MDAAASWSGSSNVSRDSDYTEVPENKQDFPEKKSINQAVHVLRNPLNV